MKKKHIQSTSTILMIQPVSFRYNEQTAVNNYYQKTLENLTADNAQERALKEFNDFTAKLIDKGINVITVKDTQTPDTPDSIFPNNWISFHENGSVGLYPMYAKNRRLERREDILEHLEKEGFIIHDIIDYTQAEEENIFLEGTGSMILDRENRKAYLAVSPRSDESLFIEFCEDFEFTPIIFKSYQTVKNHRELIYHTNVMMCVGDQYVVICLDSIDDKKEKQLVINSLQEDRKEIIAITEEQVNQFAGNMLQVQGSDSKYLVMSESAYNSLTKEQRKTIEKYNPILHSDLSVIETCGGGSARCMMAEVFLPRK
ncbi:MAG: citrulline utilization hydrolase CtlX [Flavobacteriales bacterium]